MEPPAKKSNKKKTNTCQYCERSFDGLFREHLLEHHRFTDKSATKSSSSGEYQLCVDVCAYSKLLAPYYGGAVEIETTNYINTGIGLCT